MIHDRAGVENFNSPSETPARGCPFCFKKPTFLHTWYGRTDLNERVKYYAVHCVWCKATGPIHSAVKTAISKWNQRNKYPKATAVQFSHPDYLTPRGELAWNSESVTAMAEAYYCARVPEIHDFEAQVQVLNDLLNNPSPDAIVAADEQLERLRLQLDRIDKSFEEIPSVPTPFENPPP